mmetsp:Transcript_8567/g.19430  ORF Transcript_8567/g.19430 Transcript_8567/m.19430 type:complete len:154 (+) Transcript_8567:36-497(+)
MQDTNIDDNDTMMDGSENDDDNGECPLFMVGLPSDFRTNQQLAALASLMNDEEDEEDGSSHEAPPTTEIVQSAHKNTIDNESTLIRAPTRNETTPNGSSKKINCQTAGGGGKARRIPSRASTNSHPYRRVDAPKKKTASLGEAQLFLQMWSIS